MNAHTYLHLQLRLEGKEVIKERFLRQVEPVPGEELPLILIARLENQELALYYDETIAGDLQTDVAAQSIEFSNVEPLFDILQNHSLQFEVEHYKTYIFPSHPASDVDVAYLSKLDSKVKAFGFGDLAEIVYAIERGGILVSACVSTRQNEDCGEAWVYTTPEYRHQGFAQKVVNAWARSLIDAGKIPFYSHAIENTASANLARKLRLQPVFEEIVIKRV
jgi:hypothetical protein